MGDGAWGFLGVIFSVIVSWYIAHENRKIQEKLEKNQRDFQNSINKSRIEFEREMTQKQIDANLKAKARIEWINGVRDKTSELISLLLSLQKEKTVFYEQWLEIEEVSELLKLYFNSKMNEKLNSEIYVEGNEIIISQSATFIVFKENDNIDKHAYIKRYIECLVELYKEDNYKKIINNIIIKWAVLTVLPATSVLVATLGKAYGWNGTDMTVLTINAVATFLGVITGVSAYNLKK